jgi:hypothetical protein
MFKLQRLKPPLVMRNVCLRGLEYFGARLRDRNSIDRT